MNRQLGTIIDWFDDHKRAVAKLMARENISVQVVDGLSTAKFDTVERTLSLPAWKGVTVAQMDLLTYHEVFHALRTDHTFIQRIEQRKGRKRVLFSYFNIVEDARIESYGRSAYPGCISDFYQGYKDFTTHGPFFKKVDDHTILVNGEAKKIAKMSLIDRINLHYKIGAFVKVPFTAREAVFLGKIDTCHSTSHAFDIAEELYAYAKEDEKAEAMKQAQKNMPKIKLPPMAGAGMPMDIDDMDDDGDSDDDSQDAGQSKSKSGKKNGKGDKSKDDKSKGKGKGGDKGDDAESEPKDDTAGESADHDKPGKGDGDEDDDTGDLDENSDGDDSSDGDRSEDGDDDSAAADDTGDSDEDSGAHATNRNNPKPNPKHKGKTEGAEPSESITEGDMHRAMQELVEQQQNDPTTQIKHLILKPMNEAEVARRTVPAKDWSERVWKQLERQVAKADLERQLAEIENAWSRKYMPIATHMSAEFQRRKMASRLQHARIGRTGKLDVNRLHSYKFADDLFKRTMVIPNGQSHGIVVMIDGSSSMNAVFGSVVDQVLLFAHFAFKCGIPFEAYMFSDSTQSPDRELELKSDGAQAIVPPANGRLVGLINTVTDRGSFKRQCRMLLAARSHFAGSPVRNIGSVPPYMSLGGTPLYAGMMVMERAVARMKRTMKLDKVMAVVMSDGGDTNGLYYQTHDVQRGTGRVVEAFNAIAQSAFVVRDSVTKRNFSFIATSAYGAARTYTAPPNAVLTLLFDIMKVRHDCRTIMMFLVSNNRSGASAEQTIRRAAEPQKITAHDMDTQMSNGQQFKVPNSAADCGMVVLTRALEMKPDTFAEKNLDGKSSAAIGKAFIDAQAESAANRVFVNTLMPYLI